MNSTMAAPLFTPSQWEELEHQALIFKYMMAGVPVPSDLLLPIRRGFESMAARFYHHPALSYCSFYGKKLDPEPGRCRRTDGKKWRCAKDAYPDSKYCERHMHRGRNRSRKPVENQSQPLPLPQSQQSQSPSSSSVTSLTPTGSSVGGSGGGKGSFQSGIPLRSIGGARTLSSCSGVNPTPLQIHHGPYSVVAGRDFRYTQGAKSEENELNFFSGPSGNTKSIGLDSSLDSAWRLMPSQVSSLPLSKERNISDVPSSYSQLQPLHDLEHDNINSLSRQQHSFFGSDFISSEPPKQENQSLRPFFDEWPKTRDPWSEIEDERGNKTSFSTTQLSISIPMASSDFSTTTSRSPNDD